MHIHTSSYASETTTKEEVRFLFRGSGCGLGMQRVHGGSSLMGSYLGVQEQGWEEDFDGFGGKILDPQREVSGLDLCGVFHGMIREGGGLWYWQGGGP